MVPKRVFYVWLGDRQLSNHAQQCIQSWRRHMPDYELILLNEKSVRYFNFNEELKKSNWFQTVCKRKIWALASDYIRYKVLYDHGGVYLDTDIEILKDITPLLKDYGFIGGQEIKTIGSAVLAAKKGHWLLKYVLDYHVEQIWKDPVWIGTKIMHRCLVKKYALTSSSHYQAVTIKDGILYPSHYFYPYPFTEDFSPKCIKTDTYTIHWWSKSWTTPENLRWLEYDRLNPEYKHLNISNPSSLHSVPEYRKQYALTNIFFPLMTKRIKNAHSYYYLLDCIKLLKVTISSGKKRIKLFGFLPLTK